MAADEKKPPEHVIESAINEKKEHVEEIAQPRMEKISARQEAYKRIVDATKRGMENYYRRWPERALDERSRDAEEASLHGLRDIFTILDGYVISFRNEVKTHEQHSTEPPAEPSGQRP